MSRTVEMVPEFVSTFPTPLHPGVLYVSAAYSTAAHLCCCGCQQEIITPLSPAQWVLTFDGTVSLRPSIGNWALPCRSHYVIRRGKVQWAQSYSDAQVPRDREHDRRLLAEARPEQSNWLTRVIRRVRRRLSR